MADSRLTDDQRSTIRALRAQGLQATDIARRLRVRTVAVVAALADDAKESAKPKPKRRKSNRVTLSEKPPTKRAYVTEALIQHLPPDMIVMDYDTTERFVRSVALDLRAKGVDVEVPFEHLKRKPETEAERKQVAFSIQASAYKKDPPTWASMFRTLAHLCRDHGYEDVWQEAQSMARERQVNL